MCIICLSKVTTIGRYSQKIRRNNYCRLIKYGYGIPTSLHDRQSWGVRPRAYMKSSWLLVFLQSERSAGQVNSQAYKLAKTQQLTKTSTNQRTTSQAHQHIKSPTQKLKSLSLILQQRSNFRYVLAKIYGIKLVKSHYFSLFTPWDLSIFKHRACILHHFTFLVWLPARILSTPITHF